MKTKLHKRDTYSSNRAFESVIWVIAIILLFILFSNINAAANPIKFEQESYIDEMPVDTEMVDNKTMTSDFYFEDEAFINDIPFNTGGIVANYKYKKAVWIIYNLKDETYINDIPFGTELIVKRYTFNPVLSVEFKLIDESYIDDISFDTISIDTYSNKVNKIIP